METVYGRVGIFDRNCLIDTGKLIEITFHLACEGRRFITLTCGKEVGGRYILTYHFEIDKKTVGYKVRVHENDKIPSISLIYPSAEFLENEIAKRFNLKFTFWRYSPQLAMFYDKKEEERKKTLYSLANKGREVLFGPIHPDLMEPLELKLILYDDIIFDVKPVTGYVNRRIEEMLIGKSIINANNLIQRICGRCSISHSLAYCQGIEKLYAVDIPDRAKHLRIIWAELERIQHHLSLLSNITDILGAELLSAQVNGIKEKLLDLFYEINGKRYITGMIVIGGTNDDIDRDTEIKIVVTLNEAKNQIRVIKERLLNNKIVRKRLCRTAEISADYALKLGTVGPAARAGGVENDVRTLDGIYGRFNFKPVIMHKGDCYARISVLFDEIVQSADLIEQSIDNIPGGKVRTEVSFNSKGEIISRVEQPAGELIYYIKTGAKGFIENISVKTASMANFNAFIEALKGSRIDDIAIIMDSFGICMSCLER